MPELSFVLPHWLYWTGLVLFPLLAYTLAHRTRARPGDKPVSLKVGYFLLLTGGFIGMHRLYVKSAWALVFMALFVAVLAVNVEIRASRSVLSGTANAVKLAQMKIDRSERKAEKARGRLAATDSERNRERLEEATETIAEAREDIQAKEQVLATAAATHDDWKRLAAGLGILILAGLAVDALLLPGLVRRRNVVEEAAPGYAFSCPVVEQEHDDSKEPLQAVRLISRINGFAGEMVAYWSMIAVFVYYYEVIARYVFNSPTNWAHEAMFLMFGAQYLIAGGFCLRDNAHVRVDVIYTHLPKRVKAILDLVTSVFFFIFVVTLLVTGWIFFHDAYSINEVSFTEWAIPYWPVKFALPLGAALLLIQGAAQLAKDVVVVLGRDGVELDAEVRTEG